MDSHRNQEIEVKKITRISGLSSKRKSTTKGVSLYG